MVDQTRSRVMGLRPGESYFALCRQDLFEAIAAGTPARLPEGAITDADTD